MTPELSRPRRRGSAARYSRRLQSGGAQRRSGAAYFYRARHVLDREPAAGADRHRLQRLCAAAGATRHRNHESCHDTHYTDNPDPAIKYVLRGWGPSPEEPAIWDVTYRDVRVRNVPTNIHNWMGGIERYGNSIFIFEIANLCIAHLGHLHHTLTQQQLNEIGRVDVVMAPIDGNLTLDLDGMMDVLAALKAQIIIPMHFFNQFTLGRFLDRASQQWEVERAEIPSLVVSKTTLPTNPKVLVLPGH
jgi:L-ascorbate metabolism protein UlaG (beta-lactamase superfamily)